LRLQRASPPFLRSNEVSIFVIVKKGHKKDAKTLSLNASSI
jgi:hypothetical protein